MCFLLLHIRQLIMSKPPTLSAEELLRKRDSELIQKMLAMPRCTCHDKLIELCPTEQERQWEELSSITQSANDVEITGLCYRKWYNPMWIFKGWQIKNQCLVKFIVNSSLPQ